MAGIYIHIPFCKQKCSYCDFHFSTTFSDYRDRMIAAMMKEIHQRATELNNETVDTLYFGGGTPSLLNLDELSGLVKCVRTATTLSSDAEITLEVNPDDVNRSVLHEWRSIGVNRLSIGVQSFREEDLRWMNRAHDVSEARSSLLLAQQDGFENITVDLIYGLPGLTLAEWDTHIQELLDIGVKHISAYCLTVEQKTALDKWVREGKIETVSEDVQTEQFLHLIQKLKAHGFDQYEISNFAIPGFESRHNSSYWTGVNYLGIGPSAHSFNGLQRRWNVSNNQKYIAAIAKDLPYFETEELSVQDRINELLLTGLRTREGVDLNKLNQLGAVTEEFSSTLEEFIGNEWVIREGERIRLSEEGKLKADHIASMLFSIE